MNPITLSIVEVFERFRMMPGPGDKFEEVGKQKLAEKIDTFVSADNPVRFSMLGYPFKSNNTRDKVLGLTPDLGEKVSLDNFGRFSREIERVYPHGAVFAIISDGFAFNDIWGTTGMDVRKYSDVVRDMTADLPIDWYDLCDFYPRSLGIATMREKLMADFGIPDAELERRILFEPDVNYLYRGMIRFMNEEYAIRDYPNRTQLQKAAKITARQLMHRNEAYSALVRSNFGSHIRLSMHKSINDGTKYSYQLIPSQNAPHSPWHACLVLRKYGQMETMHRKDAESEGFELVQVDGKPSHFQEL